MLDHFPDKMEVAMAEQAFEQGRATCYDMDVLRFAHPERNYAACDPISEFFDAITGGVLPW